MRRATKLAATLAAIVVLGGASLATAQANRIQEIIRLGGSQAFLGVSMEEVTAENMAKYKLAGEKGVIVQSVEKDSPAEKAGIRAGDVILEFVGQPVLSMAQMSRMVQEMPVGRTVDLVVSRDGKKVNLSAKLAKSEARGIEALVGAMPRMERERDLRDRELELRRLLPEGRSFRFSFPEGGRWVVETARPRLGVTLDSISDQMGAFLGVPGGKGALVTTVEKETPAEGKLKAGDVIVGVDGKSVDSPDGLMRAIRDKGADAKVDLKIIREKKEMTVSVELAGGVRRGYRF